MRNQKSKKGFTLIELLIVIAIIGILAAILIPNLLRARRVAVDRAAQGFVQNIYTAGNAYLAEWLDADVDTVTGIDADCDDAGGFALPGYSVSPPSFSSSDCAVSNNAGDFSISLTYSGGVAGTATLTFP